ncbi:MAG: TPM domain-containing protein [Bacteroidales bacterium]|nr:TPM domain-containing protein [Bacteroidales bacterium]
MTSNLIKSPSRLFSFQDEADVKQAILNAELDTSGEIRVHIESTCQGDVLDRAAFIFEKLNMHNTEMRNGVLFYLAVKNRKFAVIGDVGINVNVPESFWEELNMEILSYFRENQFAEGLIYGIGRTGEYLKKYFPYQKGDRNELSDDISYG